MLANLTTALTALALSAAAPEAPQWEADYGAALKQTRADDRPMLIVIDKPGVEKQQLDPSLLGEEKAALLGSYDLCRVDASTEYGEKVAEAFSVKVFPFVAVIDKSGAVILHSQSGAMTADTWKSTLTKYQKGERAVRHTVAKPVTSESGVYVETNTVESTPVYSTPSNYYYNPVGDCPNCRRGY